MIIKQDYSAMVIVLLLVIFMICGFGFLARGELNVSTTLSPSTTPATVKPAGIADNDEPARPAEASQGCAAAVAAIPVMDSTPPEPLPPAPQPEEPRTKQDQMALLTILFGGIFLVAILLFILAIAVVDRIRNDAYLREQQIAAHFIEQQRRLAELRAIAHSHRAREASGQPTVPAKRNGSRP
ncbi:MAG TPA: hypothetical protein VLH60_04165, partial [Sedimentisphaerales bacterium]|nr:hypothetical protein [Sedimentisphaerales bacterium]